MKKRRPKHRSNLACRLIGWHDRLFRVVALSTDGMATSSFIEKCKSLFISEASMAVEKAQSKIIAARSKGDEIIAQFSTPLSPDDTPDDIAAKEHVLEQEHFPKVIEQLLKEL